MSFFKKIFNSSNRDATDTPLNNSTMSGFGRYTDVNKTPEQLGFWDKSTALFNQKKYVESYYNLMFYLNDPLINNVTVNHRDTYIEFEIVQGSKIIKGRADNEKISTEARIAQFDRLSVSFLRQLMALNFTHQYTRFAIKDHDIYLKFDSKSIDASPTKVYFSLKELALKADKMDDYLVNEFDTLRPVDCNHIEEISDKQKAIKYKYLIQWINTDLDHISKLNEERFSGAISFILLSLSFRIDYLLQPQGNTFNIIEKIAGIYYAKDNKQTFERNRLMIDEFKKIISMLEHELIKDFYNIKATFGYVSVTSHKQFYEFILEQFKNTQWYYENKHEDIVTAIYEYIIGYSLFYFGLYPVSYQLLNLAFAVLQPDFFREMNVWSGLNFYNPTTKTFDKSAIEKEIQKILKRHQKDYPNLNLKYQNLKYRNLNEFLFTYLNEITYLNFSK